MQQQESFYSIDNSKSEFTFIEDGKQEPNRPQNILEKFDIRQSSAVELYQSDLLNKSFSSVMDKVKEKEKENDLNDISAIGQPQGNQLQCSVCLQNQIDCLSIPPQPSPQQLNIIQQKITNLKNNQSLLQRQIAAFNELLLKTNNPKDLIVSMSSFTKKKCEHNEDAQPFSRYPNQVAVRTIQQQLIPKEQRQQKKHFNIKPNRIQTPTEKQVNSKYKQCSFNTKAILLQDNQNQFRVQLHYNKDNLCINVINCQKGETNFIHAARINQPSFVDKISQKIVYPIERYIPKRFTLSLSIMLLIFEQNKEKQQSNLIQIQQIRTISVPLPINYFIEPRFQGLRGSLQEKVKRKLYIYEIDINYNADYAAYKRLMEEEWVVNKWVSLVGGNRLIWVDVGEVREKDESFAVGFRVGCKEKDCQQAVDLIEYLCFMLAI